ncbi:MAG: biotin/lipoyl-binding protein [Candidatus Abyssobacteria bacterium SURF_17]|uniref:Biotin/lipoyl-binding protein n=1 Tax=Candidatus Abyssobacteria bacterium SURF_17 TaxID=2093361 RepID=A0A419EXG9_9BACT|nr:MAG: biotin/lipoyl-binding protein [Candidatus Abyssubacteria bacterium SURF_17]
MTPLRSKSSKQQKATKTIATNPIKITDTTFRDGHQSTLATRMRTEDMLPIASRMNQVGFFSMEVWGGATFDVPTRFLNEDPWDRLRTLKQQIPDTPLQMLLRGQNLVGYRQYPDDVVRAFVKESAEAGVDVFRVFDALNDERNFETSFEAIKKAGKTIQGTVCYSLTERRLGGPVFNTKYFVNKAKTLQRMGADILCVKDMAGLISPPDAFDLIRALKDAVDIPVCLHTHYTSGMASMAYLKAIEAGVDIIDTALAPFALRSSQPAVEPILVALQGTDRDPGLDLNEIIELGQYIESIAPKYKHLLDSTNMAVIDTGVLKHQIPGGMTTNLVSQLKEAGALDRIKEVYEELPRTRKELGYPPLVTPTSQIVGIQAVQNVLFGRYQMVSDQVKDYMFGLYGLPPAPVDKRIQEICLKGYSRGQTPTTKRPADLLEPGMQKARDEAKDLAKNETDVLIVALYPVTGKRFLKWKYGLEPVPTDVKPKTLEDVKRENELIQKALKGELVEKPKKEPPKKGPGVRTFNVFVDGGYYEVEVEEAGAIPVVQCITPGAPSAPSAPAAAPQHAAASAAPAAPNPPAAATVWPKAPAKPESKSEPVAVKGAAIISAPMPGVIIKVLVKEGDSVKAGDAVVILEAMKVENTLTTPSAGKVVAVNCKQGDQVKKGDVLVQIGS